MPWMAALPTRANYKIKVPAREDRPARTATMTLGWGCTHVRLRRVLRNYTLRWRIEEIHRTLKSGAHNLDTSQLGSRAREPWRSTSPRRRNGCLHGEAG